MCGGGLERDPASSLDSIQGHTGEAPDPTFSPTSLLTPRKRAASTAKRRLALSVAALLAAIAVGIGAAFLVQSRLHDSGSAAPAVGEVKDEDILVTTGKENDVLEVASSRTGFPVKPVAVFTTGGRRLEGVTISTQPGLPTSARLRYVLRSKDGELISVIFVEEHNLRFTGPANATGGDDPAHPDPTRKMDVGVDGVEAWDSGGGPTYWTYTLFTDKKTYFIHIQGGHLTIDEVKAAALALR